MIRKVEHHDVEAAAAMMEGAFKEIGIVPEGYNNMRHQIDIAKQCANDGLSYGAWSGETPIGGILAVYQDNVMCPLVKEIVVLCIWIQPEWRGRTHFYRLLTTFLDNADGKADRIIINHLPLHTNADFTKLGFRLEQQNYVR